MVSFFLFFLKHSFQIPINPMIIQGNGRALGKNLNGARTADENVQQAMAASLC